MDELADEKRQQIAELTKLGHKTLTGGSPIEASEIFREVCLLAERLSDAFVVRGCNFNLGACYVVVGEAKLGLKYLEQAIPPDDADDGLENQADLWYNIGVARHAIGDTEKALIAYEKALLCYEKLDAKKLEGECLTKLAVCYHLQKQFENSYRMYQKSQLLYGELGDKSNQALSLVSAVSVLSEIGDIDLCAKLLDVLLDVCQDVDNKHLQAKIYHDIGLLYISEKLYDSAAECFEQSLKCLQNGVVDDKLLEATLKQNLGAAYNYLQRYERAIEIHLDSADLYGEVGDRVAQTQVFGNLAFAYTQTNSYEEALTAFQHAIQAAKDCGDKEAQCLAMEGIAAIWYRLKDYNKAISFYKDSLVQLSVSKEKNSAHADRIVEKLTDAIHSRLLEEHEQVDRSRAEMLALEYRGKVTESKQRLSRVAQQESLIAKGLEEISSYEDSSDQDSESDDVDSQYTAKTQPKHEIRMEKLKTFQRRESVTKQKSSEFVRKPIVQEEGLKFNTTAPLSTHHQYEQLTRAEREIFLASVAQKDADKRAARVEASKGSSKMCVVM